MLDATVQQHAWRGKVLLCLLFLFAIVSSVGSRRRNKVWGWDFIGEPATVD